MLILKLLSGTTVLLYKFAAKQKKAHKLGVKNFLEKLRTTRDGLVKGTEKRQGKKHEKTTLLQKNPVKERLKE